MVAQLLYKWAVTKEIDKTLDILGADSTASNTVCNAGIIAWLEKLLGKKLHWLICMLHTNELGLRHLIKILDGNTSSKTGISGPLGKMLGKVNDMEPDFDFKKIDIGSEMLELPHKVMTSQETRKCSTTGGEL